MNELDDNHFAAIFLGTGLDVAIIAKFSGFSRKRRDILLLFERADRRKTQRSTCLKAFEPRPSQN